MMYRPFGMLLALLAVAALLAACAAPPAPTAVPTKPAAVPAAASPAATTGVPAAATKPAAAAATATPAAKVKRGGTLNLSQDKDVDSLDPHLGSVGGVYHTSLLYDALVTHRYNEQTKLFEVKPELATEWKWENPTTAIFKIRKGVKFHDGSDLDAKVVAWNLDRMKGDKKSRIKNSAAIVVIDNVTAVDNETVKVTLKSPSAAFFGLLAPGDNQGPYIISQKAAETAGDDFGLRPVGTGVMKFAEWKTNDYTKFVKWDQYWEKGVDGQPLPYIDTAYSRQKSDKNVQSIELRAGNIDFMERPLGKDLAILRQDPKVVVYDAPWAGSNFTLVLNINRAPFNNRTARQAVNYALDREAVAKVVGFDLKQVAYHFWKPGLLGYDETLPKYEKNPEKAKAMLKDAGLTTPLSAELKASNVSQHAMTSEVVQHQFGQVGVNATMDRLEHVAWYNVLELGTWDITTWRVSITNPDPDNMANSFVTGMNRYLYSNKDLDRCFEEGRVQLDEKQRGEIYKKCQKIMYEDAGLQPIWFDMRSDATSKRVKGFIPQPWGWYLKYVWLDQ